MPAGAAAVSRSRQEEGDGAVWAGGEEPAQGSASAIPGPDGSSALTHRVGSPGGVHRDPVPSPLLRVINQHPVSLGVLPAGSPSAHLGLVTPNAANLPWEMPFAFPAPTSVPWGRGCAGRAVSPLWGCPPAPYWDPGPSMGLV